MKKSAIQLPVPAEQLVPHEPPVRLIRHLIELQGDTGVVESILLSDCTLFKKGQFDNAAILELMAQAYAAMKGYQDLLDDRPIGRGYLVGVRKFEMLGTFDTTDRLIVRVKTVGSFNDFYVAEGKVLAGSTCIAIGNMKLWIPSDD